MRGLELLTVSIYFIFSFFISSTVGVYVISIFDRLLIKSKNKILEKYKLEIFFLSIPLGLAVVAYINLFLGLFGYFNKNLILITIFLILLIAIRRAKFVANSVYSFSKIIIRNLYKNKLLIIPFILSILIIGSLYLASLQPPRVADELSYHFPQVKDIVVNERVDPQFLGHPFYGNLPKTMEILFAIGTSVSGYSFAHTLNFLILLSFLGIVFSFLYRIYGFKTATIAPILLLLYDDFTWNATTGYIDTAATGMEIASLLLILLWILHKNSILLILSSVSIGFALSTKYSPFPTAIFIGLIFLLSRKNKFFNSLLPFTIPAFLLTLFWYAKNFYYFHNPLYPLYFGHKGLSELAYTELINAIQQFGLKTSANFFDLINNFNNIHSITVYMSFFIPFVIPLIKRNRNTSLIMFAYYVLYLIYWFFFATHQTRFLMPALVTASILTSVVVAKHFNKLLIILTGILIIFILLPTTRYRTLKALDNYGSVKLHVVERQYALGNITKKEFLVRNFGCQYEVINFLEENNLNGIVIDNWSVWHALNVSFYAESNKFITLGLNDNREISQALEISESANAKYIYFNEKVKGRHLQNTDQQIIESKLKKLPLEEYLLNKSDLIFTSEDCRLYKINYSN